MTSVRLGADLERRLANAARVHGVSESQIIREAVEERCARILGDRLDARLADYVGAMAFGGGSALGTGEQFAALVREKHDTRRRR